MGKQGEGARVSSGGRITGAGRAVKPKPRTGDPGDGLRRGEKKATPEREAARAWNDCWGQKTAPSAHNPLIGSNIVAEAPLAGLSFFERPDQQSYNRPIARGSFSLPAGRPPCNARASPTPKTI